MNRIDRVSAILIHLQTKKYVTANEIADRFEISKRTVYRDIKALEEAGIPIGAEAGKGYFIVEGFHLPPVTFTKDEASSMLVAEKMVEKLTDVSVSKHFKSAMFKIKSVLPDKEKQFLEDLQPNIEVFYSMKSDFPNNYLSDIQMALANRNTLTIDYQSIYKGELTKNRTIEPVGLCFYSLGWHLIAFCQLRSEYRDFRVDRITRLSLNDEFCQKRELNSVQKYFAQASKTMELLEVTLKFDKAVMPIIQTIKYYYGFVYEKEIDGQMHLHFVTESLESFGRWLIMFADVVAVIDPPKLEDILCDYIRSIRKRL
jgi:predicted DNA-binding transcriptional regulator YafY